MRDIVMCTTCKFSATEKLAPDGRTGGETLIAHMREAIAARGVDLPVVTQACLWNCKRHCSVVLRDGERFTYFTGDHEPSRDQAEAILDWFALHEQSETGEVPFRQWPDRMRGHFIARIPQGSGMSRLTLVLGGARSGKSRFAEGLAQSHGGPKTYIATAEPFDDEMRQRIAKHREQRAGDGWRTVEAPLDIAAALPCEGLVLLDCVTVWLGNLMHHERDLRSEVTKLCAALETCPAQVILVSNEVGLSIVPENAMARRFRDEQGFANQALASVADSVFFVAAGLPLKLKG